MHLMSNVRLKEDDETALHPMPSMPLKEDEEDEEEEEDDASGEITASRGELATPPGLKRAAPPRRKLRRANRVSVCVAKCRSSLRVVERAVERLRWEAVARDTAEVSVLWLEHSDSTSQAGPNQVVSKIEGMLHVCRKADLAERMQLMQDLFPREYDFVPKTWILSSKCPQQAKDLERAMAEKNGWTYICKPTAGSQGRGIRLVKNFSDLRGPLRDAFPRGGERMPPMEFVVQRYVSRPLLVDGYKFDCRVYVVVTGVVPLRAYLFKEGLARFCTTRYELPRPRNLNNVCMHLTNYAVNKCSDAFAKDAAHDAGSKRSLSSVLELVSANGPSAETLWDEIKGLAEKTLVAMRPRLVEMLASQEHGALHPVGPKAFHILGFDVLFDEHFKPTLMELNANPSLSITQLASMPGGKRTELSELDVAIKEELILQAMLVTKPLSHAEALRRRNVWLEQEPHRAWMASKPAVDEPIPLNDERRPVHAGCSLRPLPERPRSCPALEPLDFDRHTAASFMRSHLLAYRIWRHYSCTPSGFCAVKPGQQRRLHGFGRAQFRQLCDVAGLCGEGGLWPSRTAAELFFARLARGQDEKPETIAQALDFPRFVCHVAIPLGRLLASEGSGSRALEAFVARAWPFEMPASAGMPARAQCLRVDIPLPAEVVARDYAQAPDY